MKTTATEQSGTDRLLRAVADEQRRAVLRTLAAADAELDYGTLTERVVDRLRSDDATLPLSEHRGRVKISLYHTHLPKLADCGLVVNDSDGKVARIAAADRTQALLDSVNSFE